MVFRTRTVTPHWKSRGRNATVPTAGRDAQERARNRRDKKKRKRKEQQKARRLATEVCHNALHQPQTSGPRTERVRKRRQRVGDEEVRKEKGIPGDAITIYTDGACTENGKVGAKAGYGVFFGDNDSRNISARLIGRHQTNQRAELFAVLKALETIHLGSQGEFRGRPVFILTDSMYTINALTIWGQSWERSDWRRPDGQIVVSKDIIKRARDLLRLLHDLKIRVKITHVRGHSGVWGNEMADQLAVRGAKEPPVREWIWDKEFDDQNLEEEIRESLEYDDEELDGLIAGFKND
jgi:ribonuclease HI